MQKYIVQSDGVGGCGNKIFNTGDKVVSSNFPNGNAETLAEMGFLKKDDSIDKEIVVIPTEEVKKAEEKVLKAESKAISSKLKASIEVDLNGVDNDSFSDNIE